MVSNLNYEFDRRIHSIILNPYLTNEEFKDNCDLIKKYNIKNVSTSLSFLNILKDSLFNHNVKINALISFPFSDIPTDFVSELIAFAKDSGAEKVEYIPKFFLLNNNEENFANDIERISESDLPITLIFNKRKLKKESFIKAINISVEIGITNFQFGDGFGGALEADEIHEIIKILGKNKFIKIVGGITNIQQVIDLLDTGVDCVGSSNIYDIFQSIKKFK